MSLPDLTGVVAVITGASRGIGAGLAEDFAARGMRLGLCSRGAPALVDSPEVVAAQLDVREEKAMESFVARVEDRFGDIALWINNAGVLEPMAPLRNIEVAAFREHIDVNVTGVFLGTRAYVRHLHARRRAGVLINISSGAAWNGYEGWSAYCAGKAAVERLTECVHLEEERLGLRAYAVAPGVVDTAMQELIRACPADRFPAVDRFQQMKQEDSFNTPPFVARHLLEIAFDPDQRPKEFAIRLPDEQ